MTKHLIKYFAIIWFLTISLSVRAQFTIAVSQGFNFKLGNIASVFNNGSNLGLGNGATLSGMYRFSPNWRGGIEASFYNHSGNDNAGFSLLYTIRQVNAIVNYSFGNKGIMPYIGGLIGYSEFTQNISHPNFSWPYSYSYTLSGISIAPVVGIRYGFSSKAGVDVSIRYVFSKLSSANGEAGLRSNLSQVPVTVGLYFNLGGK
jgi:hypothetical protein